MLNLIYALLAQSHWKLLGSMLVLCHLMHGLANTNNPSVLQDTQSLKSHSMKMFSLPMEAAVSPLIRAGEPSQQCPVLQQLEAAAP